MSVTAGTATTGITIAGLIALAGALGIAVNQKDINSMGEANFKNDLINKIETKTGKSIQEWWDNQEMGNVSEYSQAAEAAKDTTEWDKERNKLNNAANQNAETWGAQWNPAQFMTAEQAATAGTATPEPPKEEKDKTVLPSIPTINEDEGTVGETVQQTWNLEDIQKYIEEAQAKQWEREDQIRKETQEREDTAYQRAVADMRKAGINPNLMNINPADSGGGITQATGMDMSTLNTKITTLSNELIKILDREFTGDENTQKQITELIGTLISTYGMYLTFKK